MDDWQARQVLPDGETARGPIQQLVTSQLNSTDSKSQVLLPQVASLEVCTAYRIYNISCLAMDEISPEYDVVVLGTGLPFLLPICASSLS